MSKKTDRRPQEATMKEQIYIGTGLIQPRLQITCNDLLKDDLVDRSSYVLFFEGVC